MKWWVSVQGVELDILGPRRHALELIHIHEAQGRTDCVGLLRKYGDCRSPPPTAARWRQEEHRSGELKQRRLVVREMDEDEPWHPTEVGGGDGTWVPRSFESLPISPPLSECMKLKSVPLGQLVL